MVVFFPVTGEEAEEFLNSVLIRNEKDVEGAPKEMKPIAARSASHGHEEVAKFPLLLRVRSTFLPRLEYCHDIPLIDLLSLDHRQDATTAALVEAAACWGVFQVTFNMQH
jgi:hypothetical protein